MHMVGRTEGPTELEHQRNTARKDCASAVKGRMNGGGNNSRSATELGALRCKKLVERRNATQPGKLGVGTDLLHIGESLVEGAPQVVDGAIVHSSPHTAL